MRKLAGVAIWFVVCGILLSACGGSSDQADSSSQKPTKTEEANVFAWYNSDGGPPFAEVHAYDGEGWRPSVAVSFITGANGVRIERNAHTKIFRAELRYGYNTSPNPPQWDGKSVVPLYKPITTNNGKSRQIGLKEITITLHDPRFPDYHRP